MSGSCASSRGRRSPERRARPARRPLARRDAQPRAPAQGVGGHPAHPRPARPGDGRVLPARLRDRDARSPRRRGTPAVRDDGPGDPAGHLGRLGDGGDRCSARGHRAQHRRAPEGPAAAVLQGRRPAADDACCASRSSSPPRRCPLLSERDADPHCDRDLERRALHALRRAARRRAARGPAAPGDGIETVHHRRHLRRRRGRRAARPRARRASRARSTRSSGAIGHDFYTGEREGAKGFPRFTDPRLRGPEQYADYVRMATERSPRAPRRRCLRPAAAAQPGPDRLHEPGRLGRARRRARARA